MLREAILFAGYTHIFLLVSQLQFLISYHLLRLAQRVATVMWNIWGRIFPWIAGMSVLCASCGCPGSLLWYAHYISANHKIFWVGRVPQGSSLANTCYRLPLWASPGENPVPWDRDFGLLLVTSVSPIPPHTSLFAGVLWKPPCPFPQARASLFLMANDPDGLPSTSENSQHTGLGLCLLIL